MFVSVTTKLKLYNTCILPIFLYGSWELGTSGQLPRETHTKLMLSIHGVCKSCYESNGVATCGMVMWDRWTTKQPLLSAIVQARCFPCLATLC